MFLIFRRFWIHLACTVVALGLWETPFVKPFRVFVVLVHEMGHAGAALMTGGKVVEMRVQWQEAGQALTQGGFFPAISSAGYVGSALLGALLIYAGNWMVLQRILLGLIGSVTVGMTALYTPAWGIDFGFGVVSGLILLGVAVRFPQAAWMLATWVGMMLCLYSLYDFKTDLWMQTERTDAGILARYLGIPILAYPIAFCWAGVSTFVMYLALRGVVRHELQVVSQAREEADGDENPGKDVDHYS